MNGKPKADGWALPRVVTKELRAYWIEDKCSPSLRGKVLGADTTGPTVVGRYKVLHLLTYVLYVPTVDARTYIEEKTTSCHTHVRTGVLAPTWYSCTYCSPHAPTAHIAVPTSARTYPPYVVYCFNYCYKHTTTATKLLYVHPSRRSGWFF